MPLWTLLLLLSFNAHATQQDLLAQLNTTKLKSIQDLHDFAFGSCNEQWSPQPLWKRIMRLNPQLFIWGGDAIYADTQNAENLRIDYLMQNTVPDYQLFTQKIPIIGTWDDHDYGYNNADANNPIKKQSQQMFLDFIRVPSDSFIRQQQGVYSSHNFGPAHRRIKIILLDMRYHMKEPGADILGQQQWQWLEQQLKNSDAKIHFILGSYSILGRRMRISEELEDYPQAFKRFFNLISKYRPQGLVFLSGDKHFSSIFQRKGFLEFMSTGMTHTYPNSMVGRMYNKRFFPFTFYGLNFGMVRIRWQGNVPHLRLEIWGQKDKASVTRNFRLSGNHTWNAY